MRSLWPRGMAVLRGPRAAQGWMGISPGGPPFSPGEGSADHLCSLLHPSVNHGACPLLPQARPTRSPGWGLEVWQWEGSSHRP